MLGPLPRSVAVDVAGLLGPGPLCLLLAAVDADEEAARTAEDWMRWACHSQKPAVVAGCPQQRPWRSEPHWS